MNRLTRDGTAEPVSRDQIIRHAREQGDVHFPFSADHEQDWQPYPIDPYSAICDDHTYIHTCGNQGKSLVGKRCSAVAIIFSFNSQSYNYSEYLFVYRSPRSDRMIQREDVGWVALHNIYRIQLDLLRGVSICRRYFLKKGEGSIEHDTPGSRLRNSKQRYTVFMNYFVDYTDARFMYTAKRLK